MTAEDKFERVVGSLHRSALADVSWVSAAARINDMIRANGHGVTYADLSRGVEPEIYLARFFLGTERREDLEQLYFRDYYWRDEAVPRLHGLRDGEFAYKQDLYTDREKKTSAAYNEFRGANKTQNGLFIGLDGLDGCGVAWSFGDSKERGGWTRDQIRVIERLAPHIRHFVRVRRAIADARALGASLAELLENGRSGFIQLDGNGRILEANDRARDILLKRDGLRDNRGLLAAQTKAEDAELQRLLAQAVPRYGVPGVGGSIKLTRRKARAPLVLEIHPVRRVGTDYRGWRVAALVLVVDPAVRPQVDPDLAAALLGLTPTESRVAVMLASGQTVAGTARTLGCAESTVKTHLKRVHRKLGIRTRTELVRRVLSLEVLRRPLR